MYYFLLYSYYSSLPLCLSFLPSISPSLSLLLLLSVFLSLLLTYNITQLNQNSYLQWKWISINIVGQFKENISNNSRYFDNLFQLIIYKLLSFFKMSYIILLKIYVISEILIKTIWKPWIIFITYSLSSSLSLTFSLSIYLSIYLSLSLSPSLSLSLFLTQPLEVTLVTSTNKTPPPT